MCLKSSFLFKLKCVCLLLSETCAYPSRSGRMSAVWPEWVGMPLRPDWQFNPSGPELVGNLTRVGRQFYQAKIADQHGSERIGIGRQKLPIGMPTRPDRQFNAGNPPGSARIGTSFAEHGR